MKILVCPDIHQNLLTISHCIDELRSGNVDKVIFLGDVMDAWTSGPWYVDDDHNPAYVLRKLAEWKEEFGDKFAWCLGNHDFAYVNVKNRDLRISDIENAIYISGHQHNHHNEISKEFDKYRHLIQLADYTDGVMYSHAGFTNKWLKEFLIKHLHGGERPKSYMQIYKEEIQNPEKILNFMNANWHSPDVSRRYFDHRSYSPTGNDPMEGPLWVRPEALMMDSAFPIQVVGHTELNKVEKFFDKKKKNITVCVDTPDHNSCVYITNGNIDTMQPVKFTRDMDTFSSYWS